MFESLGNSPMLNILPEIDETIYFTSLSKTIYFVLNNLKNNNIYFDMQQRKIEETSI